MWNLSNCLINFIFFEDLLSSYLSFRTAVPCICAKVSWICELATLSEQLVYPEDVQNQLKYEKIKNYFAQMMLQLLVEYLLDYDNLDLYNLIKRILNNIKHCLNKFHVKLWNSLLTYTIEISYLLNLEDFQFQNITIFDQTTKEQPIHTYIKVTQYQ